MRFFISTVLQCEGVDERHDGFHERELFSSSAETELLPIHGAHREREVIEVAKTCQ